MIAAMSGEWDDLRGGVFFLYISVYVRYFYDLEKYNKCKFSFLPINNCFSFRVEECIYPRKWTRSEKSCMSRKWTRMGWWEYNMLISIDERLFSNSIITPEEEDDSLFFLRNNTYDAISKNLPSSIFMRCRFPLSYRENTIEKEDSLLCPISEISMYAFYTCIWFDLFEDITETRLSFRTIRDRKRESHSGSSRMIGILPEYDDFYLLEVSRIECSKYIIAFRKTSSRRIFFFYKLCKTLPIWLIKFGRKHIIPWWMNTHSHMMIVVSHLDIANL